MSAANKATILAGMGISEGGYTNDPNDPGGPTNKGITIATLTAWRNKNAVVPVVVTIDDVKNLSLNEAQQILWTEYAVPVRSDDLPSGLDYAVVDFAVNSGPGRAVKVLQALVGSTPDGIMGVKTLAAVAAINPEKVINDYQDARLAFMKSLSNWSTFKNGWTTRVEQVRQTAIDLSRGKPGAPLAPAGPDTPPLAPTAKASPTKVSIFKNGVGLAQITTMATAVAAAVPPIIDQLSPLSHFKTVGTVVSILTAVSAGAGIVIVLSKLRSGQASV